MAAQLLGDRLYLPRRHSLHVHFRQRRHQRTLGALIAFEQLGREPPGAVLRHAQLQLADPSDQRPAVIARPVALPARGPFAFLGAERLRHLRFEHLLQRRPHQRLQKLLVLRQNGFDVDRPSFTLPLGHGVHPRQRIR